LEQRALLTLLPAPTTASIGVFQEQLTFDTLSPEVVFAATHSAGSSKLAAVQNLLYKTLNPDWYLLHYQLGTGSSAFPYLIDGQWRQDFDPTRPDFYAHAPAGPGGVTSHEDWFEHSDGSLDPSTAGNRFVASDVLYLMDTESPGWRDYEAQTILANIQATGAGGVWADSFTGPCVGFYTHQGDRRFDYGGGIPGPADPSLWPDGRDWLVRAADYLAYIQGQLTAAGEAIYGPGGGFAYVPNVDTMTTGWADIDYSATKGAFAEGFGQTAGGDWVLSMNRALRFTTTANAANADRMFIMEPYINNQPDTPEGLRQRSWLFGTYLLLRGDHTYVNLYGAPVSSRLEWYPEYQVNLGAAADPNGMPATVDGYYDAGSQLYRRFFQNGLVLLNNSGSTRTYLLDGPMQKVIVNGWGGGVRFGDIDPLSNQYTAGWLSAQMVDAVTVGPYSSVMLINPGVPIEAPSGNVSSGVAVLLANATDRGSIDLSRQVADAVGTRPGQPLDHSQPTASSVAEAISCASRVRSCGASLDMPNSITLGAGHQSAGIFDFSVVTMTPCDFLSVAQ
jgi:hypothetical protein